MSSALKQFLYTNNIIYQVVKNTFLVARQLKHKRINLTTVAEVREAVAKISTYFEISPEEGFRYMDSFSFNPSRRFNSDPFSPGYKQQQMELYQELSGRSHYMAENAEHTEFDFDKYMGSPYPYNSGAPRIIGDHIVAYGHLLKTLNLPIGAKILDMAVGAGETSIMFARAGYEVTALDINPKFVELVKQKASDMRLNINITAANMMGFETSEKFDAIVFHESFHHCLDHFDLLKKVKQWRKPQGVIAFSAEPVGFFGFPWGLRCDGQSLWAIVNFGWMELGFSHNYFYEMTRRLGLNCRENTNSTSHMARVFVCR